MSPELTPERRASLLVRLCDPFPPNDVLWRVINTSKDKARGEVAAYVKKRVYHDRLNSLFTTSGWSSTFVSNITSNLTRSKNNQLISTGKVMLVCTVSIDGFGMHSSTGEGWLDDENAMTSAESQSFKRACAQFGLGRYIELLNNDKPWVDLDQRKQPRTRPQLPGWALPRALQPRERPQPTIAATQGTQLKTGSATATQPAAQKLAARPVAAQTTSTKPTLVEPGTGQRTETELNKQFRLLKEEVGESLFNDVVEHVKVSFEEGKYHGDRNTKTLECFKRTQVLIQRLRELSEHVGESCFGRILDEYSVSALNSFTSIDQLVTVVGAIEKIAA